MGVFKAQEEVLATPAYRYPHNAWLSNYCFLGFGYRTLYLHSFLNMKTVLLGISAYYHDSAAALIIDGELVAAAQEERFTRNKHDASFPAHAVKYVLEEAGISSTHITAVIFYEKPFLKFERLLETYHAFAPKGIGSFITAMPLWINEKLFLKRNLYKELLALGCKKPRLLFAEHHLSHASSAFYPSPFEEAAILTIDGVGEWATTTIGKGTNKQIEILKELHFPHSIGLLYSAFTYYTGFRVNSGEYKLMGLAPYGNPDDAQTKDFIERIKTELIDIRDDGSCLLNMKYFRFATGLRMCYDKKWAVLFDLPPRNSEAALTQPYMNMALAIQTVTEEVILKMAATAAELSGSRNLVMAGGVALNSVANGKLLQSGLFDQIWIQPAAGDAGGALGAAYAAWHIWMNEERKIVHPDAMKGAYLGPAFTSKDIEKTIHAYDASSSYFDTAQELNKTVADIIAQGKVVGWFQGRMEYGSRALGNRSILGDARNPDMQKKMNLKIKQREGFRPFAPSVMEEDIQEYFEMQLPSPYMLHVVPVKKKRVNPLPENFYALSLYERLYYLRPTSRPLPILTSPPGFRV